MGEETTVRPGTDRLTSKQRGQACDRCWKRKQKCDRALPACTSCFEVDVQCIPRSFAIGPIRDGGGNLSHAAIPSYINKLKRKLDDLDDQLKRQRVSRLRTAPAETSQTPRIGSPNCQASQPAVALTEKDTAEIAVQEAMGEIGFLSCSAMAEPRDEKTDSSEGLAMGRLVRAALVLSGANPSLSNIDPYWWKMTTMGDRAVHLQRHLAVPFFTYFVDSIGSQLIHIDPKALWVDFNSFFEDSDDPIDNHRLESAAKAFVIYMSVATGILLSPQSGTLQGLADGFHRKATKLLSGIMISGNMIDTLNCMLSLIIYSMQSPQGGSTWHLVGLAMNKAIAFRFHKDPDAASNLNTETLLMRRNIFWSLYSLDRTVSTVMDRPFNIEDYDITVQEPEEYMSHLPDATNGFARQLIAHARLMSGIRDGVLNTVLSHYSNLSYWRDCVRAIKSEASSSGLARGVVMQLSSRAMVEILKTNGSSNFEPNKIHSSQAIEKDIIATCSEYIENQYQGSERGEFTGGFVEAYDIFTAGAVVMCLARSLSPLFADPGILNKCTALLTTVGEKFIALRVFRRVLWALSDAASGNPKFDPIVHELPPVIPAGIQDLIVKSVGQCPVMTNARE